MTVYTPVLFDFTARADGGDAPVYGTLVFKPTARQIDGPSVIPDSPWHTIYENIPLTLELAVLPAGWGWEVTENINSVRVERIIKTYDANPVNYADLPSLDPADFEPLPTPPRPGWVDDLAAETAARIAEDQNLQDQIDGGGGNWPRFVHLQPTPAATWTITHNLGAKPDFRLFTDADLTRPVFTDITYPDDNTAVVTWPSAESGRAEA